MTYSDLEGDPRRWPPLGMPTGSVRALLTLMVVAVVTTNLGRESELNILWVETLLFALAHYFTSRRLVELPKEVILRLEDEGVLRRERHPLFLPRHSIRVIILGAFIALGVYLYQEGRLANSRALSLLILIAAYLAGCLVRVICDAWNHWRGRPGWRVWGDAKALIVLAAVMFVGVPELMEETVAIPPWSEQVALSLVLFYFGSR
jgi:hypothetical protein